MYIKAHDLFPSNIHVIIWDSLDVLKAADLQIPNTASYEHYSIYFELDQFITLLLLVQRGELTKIQLFVPHYQTAQKNTLFNQQKSALG